MRSQKQSADVTARRAAEAYETALQKVQSQGKVAYPLNDALAVVYPEFKQPCAHCRKAEGTEAQPDKRRWELALVCASCASLPRESRDFALDANEREVVRLHVQKMAGVATDVGG
jgi:hypothetical protein